MLRIHLRQPEFTDRACGPFTKNKERIQKFKETGNSRYIYQSKLDKACFQHNMPYGDFKDLPRRTAANKLLHDKTFNIDKNPRYDGYQRGLASMVYKFFDKKTEDSAVKNEMMQNNKLAEELQKPVIRKLGKRKVHSSFVDNIWSADLADMQLLSKFDKAVRFLLCIVDIYNKYAWVIPLKDKRGITITNAFQKILHEFGRRPNKNGKIKAVNFKLDQ